MKKHLPYLFLTFLVFAFAFGYFGLQHNEVLKLDKRERLLAGKKKLLETAFEAESVWIEGVSKNLDQKCQDSDSAKESDSVKRKFQQCSADYLNCWLEDLNASKESSVKAIAQESGKYFSLHFGGIGKRLRFQLEHSESGLKKIYELLDTCRDSYLPESRYATGPLQKSVNDWQWDNFDLALFIDRQPVSVRDVREWLDYANFEGVEKPELPLGENPLAPAVRLNHEHQELFCAYHGGKVLRAHVYDAAAFYPPLEKEVGAKIPRGPYPEGRRRQDSYLGLQISSGETIALEDLCRSFFSKECLNLGAPLSYTVSSLSWMGMGHVLGGEFENLVNVRDIKRNLKLSSKHYSMMSKWHQIGERGYWDGVGFEASHFNWRTEDPEENSGVFGVAFRCMRQGRVYAP